MAEVDRLCEKRPKLPPGMLNPWGERTRCATCQDTGLIPVGEALPVTGADVERYYAHCPMCPEGARMRGIL